MPGETEQHEEGEDMVRKRQVVEYSSTTANLSMAQDPRLTCS